MVQRANRFGDGIGGLKRRGLLAGVAGLVGAGLAKLGTTERVRAAHSGSDESLAHAGQDNSTTTETIFRLAAPSNSWPALVGSNSSTTLITAGDGVQGFTSSTFGAGLYGEGQSNGAKGCWGKSNGHHTSVGVRGDSITEGIGVYGRTVNGTAVRAEATGGGYGVHGLGNNNIGVYGTSTNGVGVVGQSGGQIGVYGASSSNVGVWGDSGSYTALQGRTNTGLGLYATATNPGGGGRAALFDGSVTVNGAFTVAPGFPKSAGVRHPDGSVRRMYCQEAPEPWFEDFGTATLQNGRVEIALDPDFDAVVKGDDYLVFLTPRADCKGLFVSRTGPHRFVVEELQGGTSSIPFSYRLVSRRRDNVGVRLEKIDVRPAPAMPGRPT